MFWISCTHRLPKRWRCGAGSACKRRVRRLLRFARVCMYVCIYVCTWVCVDRHQVARLDLDRCRPGRYTTETTCQARADPRLSFLARCGEREVGHARENRREDELCLMEHPGAGVRDIALVISKGRITFDNRRGEQKKAQSCSGGSLPTHRALPRGDGKVEGVCCSRQNIETGT